MSRRVRCRACRGTAEVRDDGSPPPGWLSLTVSVPDWMETQSGKNYLWVGIFCSIRCILGHGPVLADAEDLARQAYDPVLPEPAPEPAGRPR